MTLNLSCCQNLNFSKFSFCKNKPKTESSSLPIGKTITLVESDHIKFDSLLPDHKDYILIKILRNEKIVSAEGDFMNDLGMEKSDFIENTLSSLAKNRELFGDFIFPLFKKINETGLMYQFCFKVDNNPRPMCCSLYPCSTPGLIASVDCVIRPARFEICLDRFVFKSTRKKNKDIMKQTLI